MALILTFNHRTKEKKVTSLTIIRQRGLGNFEWLSFDDGRATVMVGDAERLAQATLDSQQNSYITPADAVSFKSVTFDNSERKLLAQTLPYFLEDELIDDVENLHFSIGSPTTDKVPVAIVRRDLIDRWLEPMQEEAIDIQQMVAELFFVPFQEKCWSILLENDNCLIRFELYEGFTTSIETAPLTLQLLLDQIESFPDKLFVYGAGEFQDRVVAMLPELLRGKVEWQSEDYWTMVEQAFFGQQVTREGPVESPLADSRATGFESINFLQGVYVRNLPWKKWWKSWKIPAVLLAAALVLSISSAYLRVSILEQKNVELRREVEQTYRSVVPKGAVMDAEKQLRRKVAALKGQSEANFVELFAKVGQVIAQTNELTLQSLNYTGRQSEIRITVTAKNFEDVERSRVKLEQLGLKAELTGSSAEGDRTRARLKIKG
jgi:general secretion pathway protein L